MYPSFESGRAFQSQEIGSSFRRSASRFLAKTRGEKRRGQRFFKSEEILIFMPLTTHP